MNSASKNAVVALLVMSIAGCADKTTRAVPPPQAQAPSVDAGKAGAMYPPPLTPAQPETQEPQPAPPPVVAQTQPEPQPEPAPVKPKKTAPSHKGKPSPSKPATPGSTPTDSAETPGATNSASTTPPTSDSSSEQVAAAGEPAAASPIGQLSTGDAAGQAQTRKSAVDMITNTEASLNGIKRPFDAQEQETANQIKTFIQKAKQALTNDDLDGALTLATKAKVLLDELTKPA